MAGICHHRWSIVKRFEIGQDWFAIRRCRRCPEWDRVKIEISERAARLEPVKQTKSFKELEKTTGSTVEEGGTTDSGVNER